MASSGFEMSLTSFFGNIMSLLMRLKKSSVTRLVTAFSKKVMSKENICTRCWAGQKLAVT